MDAVIITLAAGFAGFIDAIVGGGGLVLIPALMATYPTTTPATLFGTNKSASVWGTAFSFWQYSRRIDLKAVIAWPAALCALMGSGLGAYAVTQVSPAGLRMALPWILLGVLIYTLMRKNLGRTHAPRYQGRAEVLWVCGIGLLLGTYDGFFGPGTGSFLVFLLVRQLGYDFLHASAYAKCLNVASNLSAIAVFAYKGHVWWHLAFMMAVANVVGSVVGTRLALHKGSGFVRAVFIAVVLALIVKTMWDAYFLV